MNTRSMNKYLITCNKRVLCWLSCIGFLSDIEVKDNENVSVILTTNYESKEDIIMAIEQEIEIVIAPNHQ